MSKRLEEIREEIDNIIFWMSQCYCGGGKIRDERLKEHKENFHWLIAQAERAETLQREAGSNRAAIHMALTYLGSGRYEEAENILDAAFERISND